jgi:hypothetical protein
MVVRAYAFLQYTLASGKTGNDEYEGGAKNGKQHSHVRGMSAVGLRQYLAGADVQQKAGEKAKVQREPIVGNAE